MITSTYHSRLAMSGTLWGTFSAVVYTASNICLRQLGEVGCDPAWVIFNRELATVVVVGIWVIFKAISRQNVLPRGVCLQRLLIAAILTQLVANLCSQWAMGTVGLTVTIPASFGTTITGGAILGWATLHERLSVRSFLAISLIWGALILLGINAGTGHAALTQGDWRSVGGLLAACAAGIVFSILNVTTCGSVRQTTSPAAIGFLISLTGVVCLGPLCLYRVGIAYWYNMPWGWTMLAALAGLLNFVAFSAQGYAMQRTTLVCANILSASQVAMAALAGVFLFHELPNVWLILGTAFTLFGVLGAGAPQSQA
jgi:drug/metabolite transporter, DME family